MEHLGAQMKPNGHRSSTSVPLDRSGEILHSRFHTLWSSSTIKSRPNLSCKRVHTQTQGKKERQEGEGTEREGHREAAALEA